MRYIFYLLFISSLFSQDTLKLKTNDILYSGKIQNVLEDQINFQKDSEKRGNIANIDLIEYLSTPGTIIIIKDGEIFKLQKRVDTSVILPSQVQPAAVQYQPGVYSKIGGVCIVIAGVINYLMVIENQQFDPLSDNYQEHQNSVNIKGKISAALLIVGGVFIARDH